MPQILIVDDEESVLTVLRRILESKGHTVTAAQDGNAAFSLVLKQDFDVVISDIPMNPMNGIELLKLIHKEQPDLPVIMLAADVSAETAKQSKEYGASACLTKPFTDDEVLDTIQQILTTQARKIHVPTLDDVVNEYMSRTKLQNFLEAKVELADELFWPSQDNPKTSVLAALNDALGKRNIPMAVFDEIMEFRETTARVKKMIAGCAKDKDTDSTRLLLEISRNIADSYAKFEGDSVKTMEYAAPLLNLERGVLTPADIQFFMDCSKFATPPEKSEDKIQIREETGAPEPQASEAPTTEAGPNAADMEPTNVRRIISELRAKPVLTFEQLVNLDADLSRRLTGVSEAAYKSVKRAIDAQASLTDVARFYPEPDLQRIQEQHISGTELQNMLTKLNSMSDRKEIRQEMEKSIQTASAKGFMTSFASRYFRRRFNAKWTKTS